MKTHTHTHTHTHTIKHTDTYTNTNMHKAGLTKRFLFSFFPPLPWAKFLNSLEEKNTQCYLYIHLANVAQRIMIYYGSYFTWVHRASSWLRCWENANWATFDWKYWTDRVLYGLFWKCLCVCECVCGYVRGLVCLCVPYLHLHLCLWAHNVKMNGRL